MASLARRTLAVFGLQRPLPAAEPHDAPAADGAAALAPLARVWAGQVGAAIAHGSESVDALSSGFAAIEGQLAQALQAAEEAARSFGGEDGMAATVQAARERLQQVLSHIESAVAANHALMDSMGQAVQATRELGETAQSVERIAQMTTLLSINARIEAARAGPAGQGFAVVADEVRKLAAQAREDSQAILGRVERIGRVIGDAAGAAEGLRRRDDELIQRCRDEMCEVIDGFGTGTERLLGASAALAGIGRETRASVADALMRLQYQDRVSQRLAHVQAGVEGFAAVLEAEGWPGAEEVAALEGALLASYTMPEEGRLHRGESEPAAGGDGLDFF